MSKFQRPSFKKTDDHFEIKFTSATPDPAPSDPNELSADEKAHAKATKRLEELRTEIEDKRARPTMDELNSMEINEELQIMNYNQGFIEPYFRQPTMDRVGFVCRVPGGWIYQFTNNGVTSQFIPLYTPCSTND